MDAAVMYRADAGGGGGRRVGVQDEDIKRVDHGDGDQ